MIAYVRVAVGHAAAEFDLKLCLASLPGSTISPRSLTLPFPAFIPGFPGDDWARLLSHWHEH